MSLGAFGQIVAERVGSLGGKGDGAGPPALADDPEPWRVAIEVQITEFGPRGSTTDRTDATSTSPDESNSQRA